jgi:hypothetical protein
MGFSIGSTAMIGNVRKRFTELKHKGWEWHSFYNGWIEGRAELVQEIRAGKFDAKSTSDCNKPHVSGMCEHPISELMFWNTGEVECKKCGYKTVPF